MLIERIGYEPLEVARGMEVDVFFSNKQKKRGKVTGISNARGTVTVENVEHEKGAIYKAGTLVKDIEKPVEEKKTQRLSKVLNIINKEPPDGWKESDIVSSGESVEKLNTKYKRTRYAPSSVPQNGYSFERK